MVSIIIINYNTFELTCNCIQSVAAHTTVPHEIVLVDNASTECDPVLFTQRFPFVRLIRNPLNNGFAAGNNLGIAAAQGDLILLLNSDTLLHEPAIDRTAAYLRQHPQLGVIGCRMVYPDGAVQHTARRFRSIGWELKDLMRPLLLLLPYRKRAVMMLGKYFNSDFDTYCDWLNGAFFMFRKSIVEQLPGGKLDDRFFMYGEDHLWCWQISQLGYQHFFYSGTTITHISSGSSSITRQLQLRHIMLRHELQIMEARKGRGLYYFLFALIYGGKEQARNLVKKWVFRLSGRLLR